MIVKCRNKIKSVTLECYGCIRKITVSYARLLRTEKKPGCSYFFCKHCLPEKVLPNGLKAELHDVISRFRYSPN